LTVYNKVKATEFRHTFPAASSGNKDMEEKKWHKIGHNHSSVAYVYTLVITARLTSFLLRLSSSAGSSSSAICEEEMSIAWL
jgi:hypothetical protein